MSVDTQRPQNNYYLERPPTRRLTEVMELVLDKGLVIDAYARISLLGTELVTIDSRMVIASVDTYLRFADAIRRLDLHQHGGNDLAQNVRRAETDDHGRMKPAQAGNGVAHDVCAKPGLDGHALPAIASNGDMRRNSDLHCEMKSPEPIVSARAPGIGHARPYDWKNPTTKGPLR